MNNKIYYLSTCSTCKQIMKETGINAQNCMMQDIKTEKISGKQLDELKKKAGSYEALFSKRAQEYAARGLKDKALTEKDYRDLILEEYTFLKRPVALIGNQVFIGNAKDNVAALKAAMAEL